eukprot:Nk52_evm97s226 gene=Nk52_evmTU97s226
MRFSLVLRMSEQLSEKINVYSKYKQTPVSMKQFIDLGANSDHVQASLKSAIFLRSELQIRLAHMVKEFDSIRPSALLEMPSTKRVRGWYIESFQDLVNAPSTEDMLASSDVPGTVNEFTELTKRIIQRHSPVVTTMAQGILELKKSLPDFGSLTSHQKLHFFLDRFYMSRIGIRMLMAQHIELFDSESQGSSNKAKGWVGVIDKNCDPTQVAADAANNAKFLCDQYYMNSPEFEIVTPNRKDEIHFPYIPSHLYHMCFELLKNSMRAVTEAYGEEDGEMPKIRIVVVEGEEDLTIKISDEGKGIKRSGIPHIFTYLYTTADAPEMDGEADMNHAPLAGFGYGLPLSRLYARYLGGDLSIISIEGFGTDAYIYLKKAPMDANEVLPSYSTAAVQHYNSSSTITDWMQLSNPQYNGKDKK